MFCQVIILLLLIHLERISPEYIIVINPSNPRPYYLIVASNHEVPFASPSQRRMVCSVAFCRSSGAIRLRLKTLVLQLLLLCILVFDHWHYFIVATTKSYAVICLTLLFLLNSFVPRAAALSIPPVTVPKAPQSLETRSQNCGFDGNSDLYGLGIRLGVYFQWLSALIIYLWYPDGRVELVGAYTAFIGAVSIATLVLTTEAHSTYTAEVLILMYIIFGGVFSTKSIAIRPKYWAKRRPQTFYSGRVANICITSLLLTVIAIYCSWFWLRGMHHDFKRTPCGTFGFLFTKMHLYNLTVFQFFAAVSNFTSIVWGLIVVVIVWLGIKMLLTSRYVEDRLGQIIDTDPTHHGFGPSMIRMELRYMALLEEWKKRRQKTNDSARPPATAHSPIHSMLGIRPRPKWAKSVYLYTCLHNQSDCSPKQHI